jgi:hypothetical protein
MSAGKVREIEEKIAEIERRMPPHSMPPAMLEELDKLEEQLEKARQAEKES